MRNQRFYEQYIREYFPLLKMKFQEAVINKNIEEQNKIKNQIYNLKSLDYIQKEQLWNTLLKIKLTNME